MLAASILLYLIFTVAIGLIASRRVHGARDFMVAGRSLPLYMNFTCVFATWFGAETVLSVSAAFTKDGLQGIPGDPFGFTACLFLVSFFFARAFYRLDLLTIGDFYHKRYGKTVEIFTSIAIALSYLGWTAAQLTALGLVLSVLMNGLGYEAMTLDVCILIGACVVVFYTTMGGMWSVALTDMIQTAVIIVGLLVIAVIMANLAGGFTHVISEASAAGKFQILPDGGYRAYLASLAGFMTAALGSIPQQDVFQRVTSAKDEQTAVRGTMLGGAFYFLFAFVPMFIAYSAVVIDANFLELFASEDERVVQRILPELILRKTPFWAQVIFFGALLSAILSTASGALLAPASLLTENVLRPIFKEITEKNMLWIVRVILVVFACAATWQAVRSNATMYHMVEGAYAVTLVGALVPLAAGIYWKRASTQGAMFSIAAGISVWLFCHFMWGEEALFPAPLVGLLASIVGMLVGSLLPHWIHDVRPEFARGYDKAS